MCGERGAGYWLHPACLSVVKGDFYALSRISYDPMLRICNFYTKLMQGLVGHIRVNDRGGGFVPFRQFQFEKHLVRYN